MPLPSFLLYELTSQDIVFVLSPAQNYLLYIGIIYVYTETHTHKQTNTRVEFFHNSYVLFSSVSVSLRRKLYV